MSVSAVHLGGSPGQPLILLGPALGTSAQTLWSPAADFLADSFHVIGWDLPGHGVSRCLTYPDFSISDLAQSVLELATSVAGAEAAFHYAGNSVGGSVGLQLLLDARHRVLTATLCCTGARIGSEAYWSERVDAVAASGTSSLVTSSAERWFAKGFLEKFPHRGSALLHALSDTDNGGYRAVCRAVGAFDVRDRLAQISTPVLAVAGEADDVTPTTMAKEISEGVQNGHLALVRDAAHLVPIEQPEMIARLIREHVERSSSANTATTDPLLKGMTVRRAVLGDSHVNRATDGMTSFTEEFQNLITKYAWGEIWTRPGLDRRSRSMITLTALIARGHQDELAMHVRAARNNGLSVNEIREVILQSAIYCGVPDANAAFRIAQQALVELGDLAPEAED